VTATDEWWLELQRPGMRIDMRFVVHNPVTGYARFQNGKIHHTAGDSTSATDDEEICWAMRDLLALINAG
jgi:hypothetical protein